MCTVLYNIASLHYQQERFCDCVSTLETALTSLMESLNMNEPVTQAGIYRLLAMSHLQMGSLTSAKQYADASLHTDPCCLSEMIRFHVALAQEAAGNLA